MQPEHLEISTDFSADGTLALAQKELKKINMFKVWSVECVWAERVEGRTQPTSPPLASLALGRVEYLYFASDAHLNARPPAPHSTPPPL